MNSLAAKADMFGNKDDECIVARLARERNDEQRKLMHVIKYGKYWEAHLEFIDHFGFEACCDRAAMATRCDCWKEHVKKHRYKG